MCPYNIVSRILLILTFITFALAAPVLVQGKRQASVNEVYAPRDMITMLGKRAIGDDLPLLWGEVEDHVPEVHVPQPDLAGEHVPEVHAQPPNLAQEHVPEVHAQPPNPADQHVPEVGGQPPDLVGVHVYMPMDGPRHFGNVWGGAGVHVPVLEPPPNLPGVHGPEQVMPWDFWNQWLPEEQAPEVHVPPHDPEAFDQESMELNDDAPPASDSESE